MTLLEKMIKMGYDEKEARSLIMAGNILINEEIIIKPSLKLKEKDIIRIKKTKQWVSRGAYKLLEAINQFKIYVNNKVCLDVGSSTGGFTEVLLANNAKKIYALDVGTNQLDFKLRQNSKIVVMEKTNLKTINQKMFNEKIDLITCDVSFISVKTLFNVIKSSNILSTNGDIIILIKPQFEAKPENVELGGYVDLKYHDEILENVFNHAKQLNFELIKITKSPILGNKSKNIEYLALFKKGENYGSK